MFFITFCLFILSRHISGSGLNKEFRYLIQKTVSRGMGVMNPSLVFCCAGEI